jgi:uncharacterized protein (TIGR00725 family)
MCEGDLAMPLPVAGVMGPGEDASAKDRSDARKLGELLATDGWVVLSGGRNSGVMREVNRGAKAVPGSLTIGILPSASAAIAPDVDVAIITEMHNARNNVNVLSSRVVVAFANGGAGTVSEIALALKAGKPVILLGPDDVARSFYLRLSKNRIVIVDSPEAAVAAARPFLSR